jgi:hypothetical protein
MATDHYVMSDQRGSAIEVEASVVRMDRKLAITDVLVYDSVRELHSRLKVCLPASCHLASSRGKAAAALPLLSYLRPGLCSAHSRYMLPGLTFAGG